MTRGAVLVGPLTIGAGTLLECADVRGCLWAGGRSGFRPGYGDHHGSSTRVQATPAFGTDDGLFTPVGGGRADRAGRYGSPTLDLTASGTGTAADPYEITGAVILEQVNVGPRALQWCRAAAEAAAGPASRTSWRAYRWLRGRQRLRRGTALHPWGRVLRQRDWDRRRAFCREVRQGALTHAEPLGEEPNAVARLTGHEEGTSPSSRRTASPTGKVLDFAYLVPALFRQTCDGRRLIWRWR